MQIADYKFYLFNGLTSHIAPGILIYVHQETGSCFVRVMRNVRKQRGKNNYPSLLKELLKNHASEVLVYIADVSKDTKEELYNASRVVKAHLTAIGVLYKDTRLYDLDIYRELLQEVKLFTIWKLTHKLTGAIYYFEEIRGVPILSKVMQRMRTFNNYVENNVVNANRIIYRFVKCNGLVDADVWEICDLDKSFISKHDARKHIAKLSEQHLKNGEIVLNRISDTDSLYYRNAVLKLPHIGINEYIK